MNTGNRDVLAIAPDGTPAWATPSSSWPSSLQPSFVDGGTSAQGWISVYAIADGARIRSRAHQLPGSE
jgi:hypothetical protein